MKVMFSDKSIIGIYQGDEADRFFLDILNEAYKDYRLKETSKFL